MATDPRLDQARGVSVVVCAYSLSRWILLKRALASIAAQDAPASQTIVVIDHNPELLERARATFAGVNVIPNAERRGLSGARNTGVKAAIGAIVAFLDDDAHADAGWLRNLASAYDQPSVVGSGGTINPEWEIAQPAWLPPAFNWVVGCTPPGRDTVVEVRNPIGGNMSFRREVFETAGFFTSDLGRIGTVPLGCEETELAIRATQALGGRILHIPDAVVSHFVPSERATLGYFVRRCWAEGLSKAAIARTVGRRPGASSEWIYVTRDLPIAIARDLAGVARGDLSGLGRVAAIATGLAVTTAGYGAGSCGVRRART